MNVVAASLLVGSLLCLPASGQVRKQRPPRSLTTRQLTSRQIAEKANRSLVIIQTKDDGGEPMAQGSGFFFKPNLIATNLHVLERASQGDIEIVDTGVRHRISEVVAVDIKHDICVLKVGGAMAATLPLNISRGIAVGDDVYVSGNPEGLKGSFSKGIISAVRPDQGLIQIDASISPGSSGGPVLNSRAEVIGIAVGGLTSGQHLNFAIPVTFLSSLPLDYHLAVNVVGSLAVNDKANQKLKGPVRTVLLSQSRSRYSRNEDRCIEGEIRLTEKLTFDVNGYLTDDVSYGSKGGVLWQNHYEYNSRGFRTRILSVFTTGSPTESKFSEAEWIDHAFKFRSYSNTVKLDDGTSAKYDSDGNEVEREYTNQEDGARMRDVYKYDLRGRLIENELYQNGNSLVFSFRHAYEQQDGYGNWTRQVKLRSDVNDPCDLTFPPEMLYREITYYQF